MGLVNFVKYLLLKILLKTGFHRKRGGVTMRNHVEMFHTSIGQNLA